MHTTEEGNFPSWFWLVQYCAQTINANHCKEKEEKKKNKRVHPLKYKYGELLEKMHSWICVRFFVAYKFLLLVFFLFSPQRFIYLFWCWLQKSSVKRNNDDVNCFEMVILECRKKSWVFWNCVRVKRVSRQLLLNAFESLHRQSVSPFNSIYNLCY